MSDPPKTGSSESNPLDDGAAECDAMLVAAEQLLALEPQEDAERDDMLQELASQFGELHLRTGNADALDHAIRYGQLTLELRPPGRSFYRWLTLRDLAFFTERRSAILGDLESLKEGIHYHEQAIAEFPGHHHRAAWQKVLAHLYNRLYLRADDDSALTKAIHCGRDALSVGIPESVERARTCHELGFSLFSRAKATGDSETLNEAIQLHEEALALYPPEHPNFAANFQSLSVSRMQQFQQNGDVSSLEDFIKLTEGQLQMPLGASTRVSFLITLNTSLYEHYQHTRDTTSLDRSIDYGEQAAILIGDEDIHIRAANCMGIAVALAERASQASDPEMLHRALLLCKEALALRPLGSTNRVDSLARISQILLEEYHLTGELTTLGEAIDVTREALELHTTEDARRANLLSSLSTQLHRRFQRTGDIMSLTHAINLSEEAMELYPPDHPNYAMSLQNLGNTRAIYFQETGDLGSLDQAKCRLELALTYHPSGHPERANTLNALGYCSALRYELKREPSYLDECIRRYRDALDLIPARHRNRATCLNNLGHQLALRGDLEEATNLHKEALQLCPKGHPNRSLCLQGLGRSFLQLGPETFQEGLSTILAAIADDFETPRERLRGGFDGLTALKEFKWDCPVVDYHSARLDIQTALVELLPRAAFMGLDLTSRLSELGEWDALGVDAASDALTLSRIPRAVELLEGARAVFWSQALRLRSPLDECDPDDAAKLKALFDTLERGSVTGTTSEISAPRWDDPRVALRFSQSHEAEKLIENIRKRPGLERFLLGPLIADLSYAAAQGPVVVLIAGSDSCHAVILRDSSEKVQHVTLKDLRRQELQAFGREIRVSNLRSREKLPEQEDRKSGSTRRFDEQSEGERLLGALWHKVVKPVIDSLNLKTARGRARPHVHWLSTGAFAFVPVHAAGIATSADRRCSRYMVSSYTPTLMALINARRGLRPVPMADIKALLIAAPFSPGCTYLDNVTQEVAVVTNVLSGASATVLELEDDAGRGAATSSVVDHLPDATILHLACHGQQDTASPLESGFCLRDGRLSVADLMRLSLPNAVLAFLSACETAKGDQTQPDQVVHLAAAMLFVGFRSVIATMWTMGDLDGPIVARVVYEELTQVDAFNPEDVPYALDTAVHKLRSQGAPPHRWAPFIHLGA